MKLRIRDDKCVGHNRCCVLAPEIFDTDEFGNAVLLNDGVVPPELEEKAELAMANCPEFAIRKDSSG